jgi:hypothetical protein
VLNNDLSNYEAPLITFNFERIVCEKFEKKPLRGIKYELNMQNINAINSLFRKDFSIYYITFEYPSKKLDDLEEELEMYGCLFSGIVKPKDIDSLRQLLRVRDAHYYDTDIGVLNLIGSRYAHQWQGYLISLWTGNV